MTATWRKSPAPSAAIAPSVLRTMNQRLLLNWLYQNGPTTRPRLARDSGLSQPTVFATMADLEGVGLARLSQQPQHGANGRPALVYEADPSAGLSLAIHLDEQALSVTVSDLSGTPLASNTSPHDAQSAGEVAQLAASTATRTVTDVGAGLDHVSAVVIATPTEVPSDRTAGDGSTRPRWLQRDLLDQLREQIPLPLTIDTAVRLAALGESAAGIAQGVTPFVYLEIGVAPKMALLIDGALYQGHTRTNGSIGSLRVASPDGTSARLDHCVTPQAATVYAQEAGGPKTATGADVLQEARGGAPWAIAAVRRQADALAQLLNTISEMLDPELIVVAGALPQTLDELGTDLTHRLSREEPERPRIMLTAPNPDVVVQGAITIGVDIAREHEFAARLGTVQSGDAGSAHSRQPRSAGRTDNRSQPG